MEDINAAISGFTILFIFTGLLATALSVPMILRRVKPNPWYGFRTAKTLADEGVWYKANAYSGRLLLGIGLSWVALAIGLRFVPGIGTDLVLYNTVYGLIVLIGLSVMVLLSLRYLRSL